MYVYQSCHVIEGVIYVCISIMRVIEGVIYVCISFMRVIEGVICMYIIHACH